MPSWKAEEAHLAGRSALRPVEVEAFGSRGGLTGVGLAVVKMDGLETQGSQEQERHIYAHVYMSR